MKRKTFDENSKLLSLLEGYLQNDRLTYQDVFVMTADMLFAGIDTLTYTTAYILYNMGTNEEKQDILYEELRQLFPSINENIHEDHFKDVPYAKAVLKETFRTHPISVGIGRILAEDGIFSNYHVPAGTIAVTQNQVSCRLPEYFSKPNSFIPERWMKGSPDYEAVHPYLVLPFGHGPRTCIARRFAEQNLLIFLLNVFRKYKVIWNGAPLDVKSSQINKPDVPLELTFIPRKN